MGFRYLELDITEQDLKARAARKEVQDLFAKAGDLAKQDQTEDVKEQLIELTNKINSLGGQGALSSICGDKELLKILLDNIKCQNGSDNRKYARIFDALDKVEDPGWASFQDEDWKWVCDGVEKIPYAVTMKNNQGNDVPFFPAPLRRAIAKVTEKLVVATSTMPGVLADKVKLEEAAKATKE